MILVTYVSCGFAASKRNLNLKVLFEFIMNTRKLILRGMDLGQCML